MTKFQKIYESVLLEMPHISFELGGENYCFDLELENHTRDWYGLLRLIHNLLGSNAVKDKYGNVLELDTHDKKTAFLEELRENPTFNLFLKKHYNKTFDDLLNLGEHNPKLNVAHGNNTSPLGTNMNTEFSATMRGSANSTGL